MSRADREDQGKAVADPVQGLVTLQSVQAKSEREKEEGRTNRPSFRTTQENVGIQTRGKAAAQDEYSPQPFAPGDGFTQKAQGNEPKRDAEKRPECKCPEASAFATPADRVIARWTNNRRAKRSGER